MAISYVQKSSRSIGSPKAQVGAPFVNVAPKWYPLEHAPLHNVAVALNEHRLPAKDHRELDRLVRLWKKSGPDWNNYRFWQESGISVDALSRAIQTAIDVPIVTMGSEAGLSIQPAQFARVPGKIRNDVLYLFGTLVLYPGAADWWGGKSGDGTCDRCGKFFVKNSLRQKRYCSEVCGHSESSSQSKKAKRTKKLLAAQSLFAEYSKLATEVRLQFPWKQWMMRQRQAKKVRLSLTFLTQNENEIHRTS